MTNRITRRGVNAGIGAALISPALAHAPAFAAGGEPIKIGFSMALTGPLAGNGKQALLGTKIWEEDVNAKGGLLGRPVKLVHYDDQSNPSTMPGIYTKLMDVDKCDLVVGPYGTNMVAPAIPIVMQKGKVFIGLFALDANGQFHYPKIFFDAAVRPDAEAVLHRGLFPGRDGAKSEADRPSPSRPRTPSSRTMPPTAPADNVKKYGLKIVYDKTYPPNTTDFSPIIRAIQATNAGSRGDLLLPAEFGRHAAVGQRTRAEAEDDGRRHGRPAGTPPSRQSSRPQLNGIVNYETWVPSPKLMAPAAGFFKKYQARAAKRASIRSATISAAGAMPICRCWPTGSTAAKSIKDDKVAGYLRSHTFDTIMASGIKFGKNGEWTKSGMLQVQYHGITDAANLETWRGMSYQTVLTPAR